MIASIRAKFITGIVFLFLIISVLSIFPAFSLNKLSKKTSAILTENHISVIYARNMSEGLVKINRSIINSFLTNSYVESSVINKEFRFFYKSLQLEKNNITESGEEKLVSEIEMGINTYRDTVILLMKSPGSAAKTLYLEERFSILFQQLMLLSEINGKAIELKTNDAKVSTKNALSQMTILGTICFLITLTFIYNFSSYFSQRFYQLYFGIKEIASSNYNQKIYFDGKDEFHEISVVLNEMAEKLNKNKQKSDLPLSVDIKKSQISKEINELKEILARISSIEEEAIDLISRLEKEK